MVPLETRAFTDTVHLGSVNDIPPYSFWQNGQLKGIEIDIVTEVYRKLGIHVDIKDYPWARLKMLVETGGIHGITGIYHLAKYKPVIEFTIPYYVSKISVFASWDYPQQLTRLKDLQGKQIGVIRGYTYTPEFDNLTEVHKISVDDDKTLVRVFGKERIDLAIAEEMPFWYFTKQMEYHDKFKKLFIVSETPISIGYSKKALGSHCARLADQTSAILKQMKEAGIIQKIIDNYLK